MSIEASAGIDLAAHIGTLVNEVRELRRERRLPRYWWVQAPSIALSSLPATNSTFGPNTGFVWAIQRIVIGPFGAVGDLINVYKGQSASAVAPQNAMTPSFTNQAAGTFAAYHAGGKGLILMPDESIVAAGTITGTNPMLNWDVIQMASADLPRFLE